MFGLLLPVMAAGLRAGDFTQHLAAAQELKRAGNFVRAQSELDLALEEARTAGDSAAIAQVLDRMGAVDDDLGHFVDAERHFQGALTIWRIRLGPDHPSLIRVVNELAAVYLETGQPGKAERLDLARWRDRLETANPSSVELLPLLDNLGTLAAMRGRFDEAFQRFQEALEVIERRGGSDSADYAWTMNNLGLACLRARQYGAAIRHLSVSLALWERVRGANVLNVGLTAYNLALAYQGAGAMESAESQMRRSFEILEPALGPDSLRIAGVLRSYGLLLGKLHRKAEAREFLARAEHIVREQAPQDPGRFAVDAADLSFGRR